MTSLPLNIDVQQILLHMLNLVILFAILYLLLYKPVKRFMQKRQAHYDALEKDAKEALSSAEAMKEDYQKKMGQAKDEALLIQKEAEGKAKKASDAMLLHAKKEADAILEKAREEAKKEHEHMLEEMDSEIDDMVAKAAEKLIFANTEDAYEKFLNTVEENLPEGTDAHA